MAKLNVGFRIEYVDKYGISRVKYRQSYESAEEYGKWLWHSGARQIRIDDKPQSVPRKERVK